ncbi:MAG: thiosulfate sulfurtransferase GlpE [Methylohalobius crimeensis]
MPYQDILPGDVEELLQWPDLIVIDHRDSDSFADGHLPKAQLSSDYLIHRIIRQRCKNPPILIYCYHGYTSRDLAAFLARFGFSRIYNLEGGWQALSAADF